MNPFQTFSINFKYNPMNFKSMDRALGGTAIIAVFTIMLLSFTPQAYADLICTNKIIGGTTFEENIIVSSGSWCQLEDMALVKGNVIMEENTSLDVFDSIIEGNIIGPITGGETVELYISKPSLVKGNVLIDGVVLIEGVDGNTLTVDGNVISHLFGFLRIWEADISGNIDAKAKGVVDIFGTFVSSNLHVIEGIGTNITLESNEVAGNFQVQKNDGGATIAVESNQVSGTMRVTENVGPSVSVDSNQIAGNLQIRANQDSLGNPNCTHSNNTVDGKPNIKDCDEVLP